MMSLRVIHDPDSSLTSVHYELNDLRPMPMPLTANGTHDGRLGSGQLTSRGVLIILLIEYADGFAMMLSVDTAKYEEAGVEAFMSEWIERLNAIDSLVDSP